MWWCVFVATLLLPGLAQARAPQAPSGRASTPTATPPAATVTVADERGALIPGARVSIQTHDGREIGHAETDATGKTRVDALAPGSYVVTIELDGFEPSRTQLDVRANTPADITVTLHISAIASTVTVAALPSRDISQAAGASLPAGLVSRPIAQRLPLSVASIREVFSLVPSVVRSSNGELSFKGATEPQSGLLINGANASDPGTGNFRLDLPVDAVEEVQVFLHPYTAEYGQFTGGLTTVDTRTAGDTWHFELNDFLPDLRFVHGHIRGIAEDSPHLNLSGPLFGNRVHIAQSASYTIAYRPVRGLEFPDNETRTEGQSYFSQVDANIFTGHAQRVTFGYFPQKNDYVGLDVFRPRPATPTVTTRDMSVTAREQAQIRGGLLSVTFSFTRFRTGVRGRGDEDLTLTPTGERGNYFATQQRRAGRAEVFAVYALPIMKLWGSHEVKVGFDLNDVANRVQYAARPVNIVRDDDTLARRIEFDEVPLIRARNREYVGFVQDRWSVASRLTFDFGLRYEDQRLADAQIVAPRAGFAYALSADGKTVLRGGVGVFYDKVPLNIRSFPSYPARTVTTFGPDGVTMMNRRRFTNVLVDAESGPVFDATLRDPADRDAFVPENLSWNVQIDRMLPHGIAVRANYIHSATTNMFIVDQELSTDGQGAVVLRSSGQSTYRALELSAHWAAKDRSLDISYTRSVARGDLNDFGSLFGDVAAPLVRPNQYSRQPTDTPNRVLMWGSLKLPARFFISPIVEIRSGFPYSVLDAEQRFVGVRNDDGRRYPLFFAVDMEVAKELQVTKKYGVRLSLRGFNLTNHFNPRDVRANLGDPKFGQFLASYRRYFAGGFDILF